MPSVEEEIYHAFDTVLPTCESSYDKPAASRQREIDIRLD